jgi:hypothetical protein
MSRRNPWGSVRRLLSGRYQVGFDELRFHDLRHTGNTLAAATGASTKELMVRMGHASPRAALSYEHATQGRDQAIAQALSEQINRAVTEAAAKVTALRQVAGSLSQVTSKREGESRGHHGPRPDGRAGQRVTLP